jgi:hypothetical protein
MMAKAKPERDEDREERIEMEIVVDAYGPEERASGWFCYLQDEIQFPFTATCIAERATSPLRLNDQVEVVGLPDDEECEREMFVTIRWKKTKLAVPLAQLQPLPAADESTKRAVEDWHYWVRMGYDFG